MGLKNVSWISSTKLPCACEEPANVILVVPSEKVLAVACPDSSNNPETTREVTSIPAEIIDFTTFKSRTGLAYRYVFEYDDDLLVEDTLITRTDIEHVICESGLTSWIRELVGQPVVIVEDEEGIKLVNQYGCEFIIPGEGSVVEPTTDFRYPINLGVAHGLGPNGSIRFLQGNFTAANGASLNSTADLIALVTSTTAISVLSPGIHTVPSHGLALGLWYALHPTTVGEYIQSSSLTSDQIQQNGFLTIDADTILVDLQEATPVRTYSEASIQTQVGHGFSVGNIVSKVSGVWVDGVAGEVAFFVTVVLTANTFVVSDRWSGPVVGVLSETLYVIDPVNDGNLVDITSLDTSVDPITEAGYAPRNGFLLGRIQYPLICCGSGGGGGEDLIAPTVASRVVPSGGTTLILTMSESIIPASGITGFTVEVDTVNNVIVSATRTASNQITLTLTDVIDAGQVVTVSYTPGNVTDIATNPLAAFVDAAVTNNSTQGSGDTLIFTESFEGGVHQGTYDNGFAISAQNALLVNSPTKATDGDYYNPYLAAAGLNDFQTYYARGSLPANYVHLKQQIDVAFIHISPAAIFL